MKAGATEQPGDAESDRFESIESVQQARNVGRRRGGDFRLKSAAVHERVTGSRSRSGIVELREVFVQLLAHAMRIREVLSHEIAATREKDSRGADGRRLDDAAKSEEVQVPSLGLEARNGRDAIAAGEDDTGPDVLERLNVGDEVFFEIVEDVVEEIVEFASGDALLRNDDGTLRFHLFSLLFC